jgi:hypothetical protein
MAIGNLVAGALDDCAATRRHAATALRASCTPRCARSRTRSRVAGRGHRRAATGMSDRKRPPRALGLRGLDRDLAASRRGGRRRRPSSPRGPRSSTTAPHHHPRALAQRTTSC